MYKHDEHTGDAARKAAASPRPFGIGVNDPRIERIEVWATSFNDPGEYCEFRCFDVDGKAIGTYRIAGY